MAKSFVGLSSAKTNNHKKSSADKAEIRALVLAQIPDARVFDAYAGAGMMWRKVWRNAANYVGCDRKWYPDDRTCYVADNRRVMRAIDLDGFNVFDFDAYGSPWECVEILAARRTVSSGERVGLVLTEGSALKLKFGDLPSSLSRFANLEKDRMGGGLNQAHELLIDRAIAQVERRLAARVIKRWEARRKSGTNMCYIGLVLEGGQ